MGGVPAKVNHVQWRLLGGCVLFPVVFFPFFVSLRVPDREAQSSSFIRKVDHGFALWNSGLKNLLRNYVDLDC